VSAGLAAVFDEGRHPVAQELGHGECGVELEGGCRAGIAVLDVAWVALDDLAFLGNGNFQKRLTVIHRPPGIGDQPMRGAVAGMDVGVDEAGRKQLALSIDDPVDSAFECFADVEDPVALEPEFSVAKEGVMPALMAHDPRRLDFGAHAVSTRAGHLLGALPSPLWGGVGGGGRETGALTLPQHHPLPSPPPQGGREQTESAAAAESVHLTGTRAVLTAPRCRPRE